MVVLFGILPLTMAFLTVSPASRQSHAATRILPSQLSLPATAMVTTPRHTIDGMDYKELVLTLPNIGNVAILEATLDTQTRLIDMALDDNPVCDSMAPQKDSSIRSKATTTVVDDVYGAVLWPAALTVASYLLQNAETLLAHQTVLEVGTGTGLVSIAAAMGGAHHVLATDYEKVPLRIVETTAKLNHVSHNQLSTRLVDICDSSQPLPSNMTVLVAADILYEPKTGRALAERVIEALQLGAHVIVGDSPGRPGRPAFLQRLAELGLENACFEDITGWSVTGDRHELICGATSTTRSDRERELVVAVMHLRPDDYRQ